MNAEKHRQDDGIDAGLMTGGTGISSRDQTFETVQQVISRPLPGYGELVRMLSYNDIGPAAMLSRATGGLMGSTLLLTMPGSGPVPPSSDTPRTETPMAVTLRSLTMPVRSSFPVICPATTVRWSAHR